MMSEGGKSLRMPIGGECPLFSPPETKGDQQNAQSLRLQKQQHEEEECWANGERDPRKSLKGETAGEGAAKMEG